MNTYFRLFLLVIAELFSVTAYSSPAFDIQDIKLNSAGLDSIQFCKVTTTAPTNTLFMRFDSEKAKIATLQFVFSEMPVHSHDSVLLLLYSRCATDKPQIETPLSPKPLTLNMSDMERLGIFEIPAMTAQPNTRLGAVSTANSQITMEVHLELEKLSKELAMGNQRFYIQAAFLEKEDFQQRHYDKALLSSSYTLYVNNTACPSSEEFLKLSHTENRLCENLKKFGLTQQEKTNVKP